MTYTKFYPAGWVNGSQGGTPVTKAALDNFDQGIADAHETKVSKGDLVFNVRDYGALGTWNGTTGSDDTAAIAAAAAALQAAGAGGTLWFPPRPAGQSYRSTAPLPNVSGMRVAGANRATTRIRFVGCDMFALAGTLQNLIIEGLYITVSNGHVFNVGGYSFLFNRIRDCWLWAATDSRSILYAAGNGDVLENWFEHCEMWRNATHTVPAFDIVNGAGGANANVFKRIRANSANCTSSPFWRIEANVTGTYAYDNSWEDIVGEQNPGGLVHLYSANGCSLKNVFDWDATTTYADHVIKLDKSPSSTTESRGFTAVNAGRRGGTLGSGLYDVYCSPNSRQVDLRGCGNHTPTPVVALPTIGGARNDSSGLRLSAGSIVQTGRDTTANRPSAATAGAGAMFFDTTLGRPIWSDGSSWLDPAAPSAGAAPDVQEFTGAGSFTWTKPAGAKAMDIVCIEPGSGGGSGRRGASGTVCGGGGGGAGGVMVHVRTLASDWGSTESITIPTAGSGGAAVTANDTNGNAGGAPSGGTIFGTASPKRIVARSSSGGGGGGGTTSGGAAGTSPLTAGANSQMSGGAVGGASAVGGSTNFAILGPAGGAGGGGISATPTAFGGGSSAPSLLGFTSAGVGGAVDSTAPTAGTMPTFKGAAGQGAGGGAASITTAAQAGANATGYGAGGGGGGASFNGNNSGAGGSGGPGYVLVVTYF